MLQLLATFDMLFSVPNTILENAIERFLPFFSGGGVNLHIDLTIYAFLSRAFELLSNSSSVRLPIRLRLSGVTCKSNADFSF